MAETAETIEAESPAPETNGDAPSSSIQIPPPQLSLQSAAFLRQLLSQVSLNLGEDGFEQTAAVGSVAKAELNAIIGFLAPQAPR
jgi:hypothetical protein